MLRANERYVLLLLRKTGGAPASAACFARLFSILCISLIPAAAKADTVATTVSAGFWPIALAVNPATNKIYVANNNFNEVTVIDGATNAPTTLTTSGQNPLSVAVNPVTNTIYVGNQNSGDVTVIDGATNALTSVSVGNTPNSIAVNPVTNKIYVVNEYSNNVTVINGKNNSPFNPVAVGMKPFAAAVNPVTNKVYVTNLQGGSVTVIDGSNNSVAATINVGGAPEAIAVNPVTNRIYSTNADGTFTVIQGDTLAATRINIGSGLTPKSIAVNPVTNKIYLGFVGQLGSAGGVIVINGSDNSTTALNTGGSPLSIAVESAANKIYAVNAGSPTQGNVTIIDGATNAFATLPVGNGPQFVAVNPLTSKAYVANFSSNSVTVIDGAVQLSESSFRAESGAATAPSSVGVDTAAGLVYIANSQAASVTVFDETTNMPVATIPTTFTDARELAVRPGLVFVTYDFEPFLTVITGTTVIAQVDLGSIPMHMAINTVSNQLYLTCSTLKIIDIPSLSVTDVLPPYDAYAPTGISVNPKTNRVYVSYLGNGSGNPSKTLGVFDGAAGRFVAAVPVGDNPEAVVVNPNTDKIYVANRSSDSVTVIDDGADLVVATISVPGGPHYLTLDPIANKVYVNTYSGYLTVIDGVTNTASVLTGPYSYFPPVINLVTGKVYAESAQGVQVFDAGSGSAAGVLGRVGLSPRAVSPITNRLYAYSPSDQRNLIEVFSPRDTPVPLTTTISRPDIFQTPSANTIFNFTVQSGFSPQAPIPDRVYFQADTWRAGWSASTAGPSFSGTTPDLAPGYHILYAYAGDSQEATSTQPGSPLLGKVAVNTEERNGMTSRGFFVPGWTTTVSTSANGPAITVDDITFTGSRTFYWSEGSKHVISTTDNQTANLGTKYAFTGWSAGPNTGQLSQTITASPYIVSYIANFDTLYPLSVAAYPGPYAGTVSDGGYYFAGDTVSVVAIPKTGYTFVNWTGPVDSPSSYATTVVMSSPKYVIANFQAVNETISVTPATGTYGGTVNLSATLTSAGSPLAGKTVSFTLQGFPVASATTNGSGVATASDVQLGNQVGEIGPGSYSSGVGASFAGDSSYGAISGTGALTVNKAAQTIIFTPPAPAVAQNGTSFTVAAISVATIGGTSADTGLTVVLSVDPASTAVCSLSGSKVTMLSATGICTIDANQSGSSLYKAADQQQTSTTGSKMNQPDLMVIAGSSLTYNTSELLGTSGGAGSGAVNFNVTGSCSISTGQLLATSGTGSCTVTATKSGDSNYNDVTSAPLTVSLQKANQTITFAPPASPTSYGANFNVAATSSSSLAVSVTAAGGCSISNGTVTMTSGTAACNLNASQSGDGNYAPATDVPRSVNAAPAALSISPDGGKTKIYGQAFTAFTGLISGLKFNDAVSASYASAGASAGAAAGPYDITVASYSFTTGNASNYTVGTPAAAGGLSVAKAGLTISPDGGKSKAYGQTFTAFTGSTSGLQGADALTVVYASAGAGISAPAASYDITVSSYTFTTGNASNYNISTPPTTGGLTVTKVNLTIVPDGGKSKIYGQTFSAFTGSVTGLQSADAVTVTYASSGAAASALAGAYDITVAGYNFTTGSASNYTIAAQKAAGGLTVGKANQTITFTPPASAVYLSTFVVNPTATSGLAVTLGLSGGCIINSGTVSMTSGVMACTLTASQAGDSNYQPASNVIRTVQALPLPIAAAVTLSSATPQYSDKITINVSIPNAGGVPPASGMNFKIGSVDLGTVALSLNAGRYTGSITSPQLVETPGPYTMSAAFVSPDADYTLSYTPAPLSLTIRQEDARSTYTGPAYVNTSSVTTNTAAIPLSFTIRDITAVGSYVAGTATTPSSGDQAYDPWAGNINNATVKIVDALTNTTMCATTTLGIVTAGDTTTATATCTFTASLPTSGSSAGFQTYAPQVVVGGYYADTNAVSEQALLTVALPLTSNFVSGGGSVAESASAGLLPGALGSKTQFGISVKYTKSGTNLQGNAYVTIRSTVVAPGDTCPADANGYHVYQFKTNSLASMATQTAGTPRTASLVAGASIVDITATATSTCSYPVDGGATFQITMTDNGSTGHTIGVGVWQAANKGGNLWFSSNWSGGKTTEIPLATGTVSVH